MIIVRVEIGCDVCHKVLNTADEMDYRTTGAAPDAIRLAKSKGWQFIRNAEDYKLQRTYCPACAFHVTKMDGD